ncbi:hypothetical protein [Halogeometricum sp. CBA1124]|nr:hypothetical protein [Halogeometricum sp. CBA1124]
MGAEQEVQYRADGSAEKQCDDRAHPQVETDGDGAIATDVPSRL